MNGRRSINWAEAAKKARESKARRQAELNRQRTGQDPRVQREDERISREKRILNPSRLEKIRPGERLTATSQLKGVLETFEVRDGEDVYSPSKHGSVFSILPKVIVKPPAGKQKYANGPWLKAEVNIHDVKFFVWGGGSEDAMVLSWHGDQLVVKQDYGTDVRNYSLAREMSEVIGRVFAGQEPEGSASEPQSTKHAVPDNVPLGQVLLNPAREHMSRLYNSTGNPVGKIFGITQSLGDALASFDRRKTSRERKNRFSMMPAWAVESLEDMDEAGIPRAEDRKAVIVYGKDYVVWAGASEHALVFEQVRGVYKVVDDYSGPLRELAKTEQST